MYSYGKEIEAKTFRNLSSHRASKRQVWDLNHGFSYFKALIVSIAPTDLSQMF